MQSGVRWQVDAAVLRLHARRVTTLEFHPTLDHIVLSGDKKGQVTSQDAESAGAMLHRLARPAGGKIVISRQVGCSGIRRQSQGFQA